MSRIKLVQYQVYILLRIAANSTQVMELHPRTKLEQHQKGNRLEGDRNTLGKEGPKDSLAGQSQDGQTEEGADQSQRREGVE